MRRSVLTMCFVLLGTVVSSCSGTAGGDCGERLNSDVGFLTTQAWMELMPSSALPTEAADTTEVYPLDVVSIDPGAVRVGPIRKKQIAVHGSFVGQIADAFQRSDQVFLALNEHGLSNQMVHYVVFRHPDGSHEFAEQCWMSDIQTSIEDAYGSQAEAKLDLLIGTTGSEQTQRLFHKLQ